MANIKIFRSSIFHFLRKPEKHSDANCYQYFDDGLLVIENGKVKMLGPADEVKKTLPSDIEIVDYSGYLITPGFIDIHIHYAQTEVIASYGEKLLEWLNGFVFPAEGKYHDKEYAKRAAGFFLDELIRNGTTTAGVYSTVHSESVDALFECAEHKNMRMLTGKTLMDRNAPAAADDDGQLAGEGVHLLQLGGDGLQHVRVDTMPTLSDERLAAQLQQHPRVAQRVGRSLRSRGNRGNRSSHGRLRQASRWILRVGNGRTAAPRCFRRAGRWPPSPAGPPSVAGL